MLTLAASQTIRVREYCERGRGIDAHAYAGAQCRHMQIRTFLSPSYRYNAALTLSRGYRCTFRCTIFKRRMMRFTTI